MKFLGVEFQYKTRHFTVVVVALTIMIALLALGFGLAAARTVPSGRSIINKTENETLYASTYQRAVDILTKYPIVDG